MLQIEDETLKIKKPNQRMADTFPWQQGVFKTLIRRLCRFGFELS